MLTNDNDVDADDTKSIVSINTAGTIGSVTNNGDGTFDYNPNGNFEFLDFGDTTTDSFTYTMQDSQGVQSTATVTITITGVNDTPTAVNDGDSTDVDADDTKSIVSINTAGTIGSVTNNGDGTFNYNPNGNFESLAAGATTTDSFTYTMQDSQGVQSSATMTITITGVNDAPVNTVPGAQTIPENTTTAIAGISVNDVDGNLASTKLTVSNGVINVTLSGGASISAGANGSATLTISGNQTDINNTLASLTYQGNIGFEGPETLTVYSEDSAGTPLSDTDTINISVGDPPTLDVNVTLTIDEDDAATIISSALLDTNDASDPDTAIIYTINTLPTLGILKLVDTELKIGETFTQDDINNNRLNYTPDENNNGADTFNFDVTDGSTILANNTFNITINPINDAPIISTTNDFYFVPLLENTSSRYYTTTVKQLMESGGVGTRYSDVGFQAYDIDTDITDDELGIAIFAANTANGVWEYSTTNGSTWSNFGVLSVNNALLLDRLNGSMQDILLRFTPTNNFSGTADINFHVWDKSTGTVFNYEDLTSTGTGGTTAFSENTETATMTVMPLTMNPSNNTTGNNIAEALYVASGSTTFTYAIGNGGGNQTVNLQANVIQGLNGADEIGEYDNAIIDMDHVFDERSSYYLYFNFGNDQFFTNYANDPDGDPTNNIIYGDAKTFTVDMYSHNNDTHPDSFNGFFWVSDESSYNTNQAHYKGGVDVIRGGAGNDTIYGDWQTINHTSTTQATGSTNSSDSVQTLAFYYGGADVIIGGAGDDSIYGDWQVENINDSNIAASNPGVTHNSTATLTAGADKFIFGEASGNDTIFDFNDGLDKIVFYRLNVLDINDLHLVQSGADVIIYEDSDGDNNPDVGTGSITIKNVIIADLTSDDFDFSPALADFYTITGYVTLGDYTRLYVNTVDGLLGNDHDYFSGTIGSSRYIEVADTSNLNGSLSIKQDGSFSYVPDVEFRGDATFTYYLHDWYGRHPVAQLVTITVASAFGEAYTSPIRENFAPYDDTDANTVQDLLDSIGVGTSEFRHFVDADGNIMGIIVIDADDTNGTWEYFDGAAWQSFGAVAINNALLLDLTTKVRFDANDNYQGEATFEFGGWDGTGGYAFNNYIVNDALTNGLGTPFTNLDYAYSATVRQTTVQSYDENLNLRDATASTTDFYGEGTANGTASFTKTVSVIGDSPYYLMAVEAYPLAGQYTMAINQSDNFTSDRIQGNNYADNLYGEFETYTLDFKTTHNHVQYIYYTAGGFFDPIYEIDPGAGRSTGNYSVNFGTDHIGASDLRDAANNIKVNTLYGDTKTIDITSNAQAETSGELYYAAPFLGAFTLTLGSAVSNVYVNGGNDLLLGNNGNDTLYGDFENIIFTGIANVSGSGTDATANGIFNFGNDVLIGGAGNDTLYGDYSTFTDNTNYGGLAGNETVITTFNRGINYFIFGENSGDDIIADFQDTKDKIVFYRPGVTQFDKLYLEQSGANVIVYEDLNGDNIGDPGTGSITVLNITVADLTSADFIFTPGIDDSYNVETYQLITKNAAAGVLSNDYNFYSSQTGASLYAQLIDSSNINGGLTLYQDGSFEYRSSLGFVGTASFTYLTHDWFGKGAIAKTVSIIVSVGAKNTNSMYISSTQANGAVSNGTDSSSNNADTISTILSSAGYGSENVRHFINQDNNAQGVAVHAADQANGNWQYFDGALWQNFGAVSDTSALILGIDTKVRFKANTDFEGTATFTMVGWNGNGSYTIGQKYNLADDGFGNPNNGVGTPFTLVDASTSAVVTQYIFALSNSTFNHVEAIFGGGDSYGNGSQSGSYGPETVTGNPSGSGLSHEIAVGLNINRTETLSNDRVEGKNFSTNLYGDYEDYTVNFGTLHSHAVSYSFDFFGNTLTWNTGYGTTTGSLTVNFGSDHVAANLSRDLLTANSDNFIFGDTQLVTVNAEATASTSNIFTVNGVHQSGVFPDAGNAVTNIILNGGDDLLSGNDGDDTLYGDWQTINYNATATVNGSGLDAKTHLTINSGNDILIGGAGNDDLYGDFDLSNLTQVDSFSTLPGTNASADSSATNGNDLFIFGLNSGTDTIHDFQKGNDHIYINDGMTNSYADLTINDLAGSWSITKKDGAIINILDPGDVLTLDSTDFYFNTPTTADSYSIAQNGVLTTNAATGVLNNDINVFADILNTPLKAKLGDVSNLNGYIQFYQDGSFEYTPDAGYLGSASFTYYADDWYGTSHATTVSLTIF